MTKQNVIIAVLAVLLFIEWGERRMLASRFESYISGLHWPDAHAKCSEVARAEHGAQIAIDKKNHWLPEGLAFGAGPQAWPWRYFRWGQFWDVKNASVSLKFSFLEGRIFFVCNYNPAGGGGARIYTEPLSPGLARRLHSHRQ